MEMTKYVKTLYIYTAVDDEKVNEALSVIDNCIEGIKKHEINFDDRTIDLMRKVLKTSVAATLEDTSDLGDYVLQQVLDGDSIYEFIEESCTTCAGKGSRVKLSYIEFLIRNEIFKINSEQDLKDIYIEIGEVYKKDIMDNVLEFTKQVGALENKVYVNFIPHLEKFKVESLIFANQIRNLQTYKIYG